MEKVTAYFRLQDGTFQKFLMDRIDFDEAVKPRTITLDNGRKKIIPASTDWTLDPPAGAIIEDMIDTPIVVERQEPVSVPVMPTASPQPLKRKILAARTS